MLPSGFLSTSTALLQATLSSLPVYKVQLKFPLAIKQGNSLSSSVCSVAKSSQEAEE